MFCRGEPKSTKFQLKGLIYNGYKKDFTAAVIPQGILKLKEQKELAAV